MIYCTCRCCFHTLDTVRTYIYIIKYWLRNDFTKKITCMYQWIYAFCYKDITCTKLFWEVWFRKQSNMDMYLVFGREKTGEDSYLIPLGGSNVVGVFGFLTVFDEIQSSVSMHLMKFQHINVFITDKQLVRT